MENDTLRETHLSAFLAVLDGTEDELSEALEQLPTDELNALYADAMWLASRARRTWRRRARVTHSAEHSESEANR